MFCSPWGCKESDMTERLNNNKEAMKGNYQIMLGPFIKHMPCAVHYSLCFSVISLHFYTSQQFFSVNILISFNSWDA